ncbi:MAG: hypothetical protein Tsb0013_06840 [Phycisphaerales bacterium]
MRTQTVVIGCSVALLGVALTAVFAPLGDVAPLVYTISKGAPPDPSDMVKIEDIPIPKATPVTDGSLRTSGSTASQDSSRATEVVSALPEVDGASPYIGTWMQESRVGDRVIRVRFVLDAQGRYEGHASLFPVGAPPHALASRTIETAGVWEQRGTNVVLSRMSTDAPDVLPMGWREVYWDSRIERGDWLYTDADGLERRLIRVGERH